jgi:hypothetical protein
VRVVLWVIYYGVWVIRGSLVSFRSREVRIGLNDAFVRIKAKNEQSPRCIRSI